MSKRNKILVRAAASLAALVVVVAVTSILILQSTGFANFVRGKIISSIEESTGGVVQIDSFQFDWRHLTVRIRNFVLHGTEPATVDPLLRIPLLELHLKLLSGIYHTVDLAYLGIQKPAVNLIVYPNGTTNMPMPKVQQKSRNSNGLETLVDLKVGQFELRDGQIKYAQQKTAFAGRGESLHALLSYNTLNPSYQGSVSMDPLLLTLGNRPPLRVRVKVPITIEKDAIRIVDAALATDRSKIGLNGSLQHLSAPIIDAHLNANISLPEIERSVDLGLNTKAAGAPQSLSAELGIHTDDKNQLIEIQTAHMGLGETTFEGSGVVRDNAHPTAAAEFNANLSLSQLGKLFKITSPQASGAIAVNGNAKLNAQNDYQVNGKLNTRNVSLRSGVTRIGDINLYTPFHVDPYLISLDGLKLGALGGSLAAKIFVEKMRQLSVQGNLQNFSLPFLATILTGKYLGYEGTADGTLRATGDLKAKGTTGYSAQARVLIHPGVHGVPVRGQLNADYNGRMDSVVLRDSYLALPNTRLDLSGALNKSLTLNLVSHDLNDFLPAANFGATKSVTSLPLTLQGGTASLQAQLTGNLSAPRITSHLAMSKFGVKQSSFDNLALDLAASPTGASIRNGILTRNSLRTDLDGSIGLKGWSPLPNSPVIANVTLRNATVTDLLSMAGQSAIPATGDISADVHVNGSYGNPLGSAVVQVVNGSAYQQPFSRLSAQINLADQLITLAPLELTSDAGRVDVTASFQHPRNSLLIGNAQVHVATSTIQLMHLKALQARSPGAAGVIQLTADAAASLREVNKQTAVDVTNVNADFSAHTLRVQNQDAGDLTATARTLNNTVRYNVSSNFGGSGINVHGQTALTKDYATAADASIQNLSIAKVLSIIGQNAIPASGDFSANAHVAGTLKAPRADLVFSLASAKVYDEPITLLRGTVHYSDTLVDVPSIKLDTPAGSLTLAASFVHPASNFNAGVVKAKLDTTDIQLAAIRHVHMGQRSLNGTLHLAADLSANLRERNGQRALLFSYLNADASARGLRMHRRELGEASFTARTSGSNLNFSLDSNIAQSKIHGSGHSQLAGEYPVQGDLTFTNIKYSNIAPFLGSEEDEQPTFDVMMEGKASVNGPMSDLDKLNARLELSRLSAQTNPLGSPTGAPPARTATIRNEGPIVAALNHNVVDIQQFHLRGPGTSVNASGTINLKDQTAPIDVDMDAKLDIGTLQDVDRDFYSSGSLTMNATVHGAFAQPLVNGSIELKNANVNYATAPNGLSNANGTILLTGTGATIKTLTAESGGGKVSVTGFAGLMNNQVTYNLRATANKVRVRYSGISITTTSAIALLGNSDRSLVSGNVRIQRIAYNSSSDAGSLLSSFASKPPTTPSAPSPLLTGMRLDIHILTAPDLRVSTTYANRLSVEANLAIRGTAENPGMLGRVVVTDGQLVFFGNTYTVSTGTVNFYNPNSIQPVLNVSLETLAQGVDVTLGVSGAMNNLQLNYRSDPPLSFEQIVQLLATNTTPNDPNIVANQPQSAQQSFTQMGESAILGQAVANPLASRVQRVFGLSQFKIDPSVTGLTGQPTARVTLQQKIFNNVTFTYISDVTQTNSQIVRVQWDLTPKFSAVGLRDYNGNVSVEFFYNFTVR